ncbi:hypothetical protein QQ045_030995 [Rhodiola kirilowii]
MTSAQNDGMTLSTIERFEILSFNEYDRDNMGNSDNDDEEGYVEVPIGGVKEFNTKVLKEGGMFMRNELLIYACKKYSIKHRQEYHPASSSTKRLILECRRGKDKCKWELRASKKKNEGMWRVTKYEGDQTCEVDIIPHDNVHLNKHFIGMDIRDLILREVEIFPLRGASFNEIKLPTYMNMLKESNLGSIVHWDTSMLESGKVSLNHVFWSFAPAIEGFKHCHPIISIDATHLIGKWKGVLMIAVSLDAENEVLPLAYALVKGENIESWKWFMTCIRSGITQRDGLCIISDRHIGIMRVMEEEDWSPPRVYHRELLNDKSDVVNRLDKVNPKIWALAYDTNGRRWGSITTNQSESFNYVLMTCRDLPITAIIHFTFKQANSWFIKRRDEMLDHNNHHVPTIERIINENIEKAGCNELWAWEHLIIGCLRRLAVPSPPTSSDVDPMRLPALGYNWRAEVPLICFNIAEWHYPSRVVCQFGWRQPGPPLPPQTHRDMHMSKRRTSEHIDAEMQVYMTLWDNRGERLVTGDPDTDGSYLDAYYTWYYSVTRKRIQPLVDTLDPYRPSGFQINLLTPMKEWPCQKITTTLAALLK